MTKKQFDWLKNHQPFEVRYIRPYENYKGEYTWCSIRHLKFNGEFFDVDGITPWNGKLVHYRIHRKYVRCLRWYNGLLARYNTEGNIKGKSLKKLS